MMPRKERPKAPEIGKWLQLRRKFLGRTQEQIAKAISDLAAQSAGDNRHERCSVRTIVNYEAGLTSNMRLGRELAGALELPEEIHAAFVRWVTQQPCEPAWHPPSPRASFRMPSSRATVSQPELPEASECLEPIPQIGRLTVQQDQVATLGQLLGLQQVVILTGMPGLGKTTLAAALARREQRHRRVFWLTMPPDATLMSVLWHLAAICEVQRVRGPWALIQHWSQRDNFEELTSVLATQVLHALHAIPALICFDSVEQAAQDPQIMGFLKQLVSQVSAQAGTAALRVVIVANERLEPELPADLHVTLPRLTELEMAQWLQVNAPNLDPQHYDVLGQLAEGVPGLLRLAAQVLAHAPDRAPVLAEIAEARNTAALLGTMLFEDLTPPERTVMAALAVLGDRSTRSAVESTARISGTMLTLQGLVQRHLIDEQRTDSQRSFHQHMIYRGYYRHVLDAADLRDMHRRAAQHFALLEPDPIRAAQHYTQAHEYAQAADQIRPYVWLIVKRGGARALLTVLEQIMDQQPNRLAGIELRILAGETAALIGGVEQARAYLVAAFDQLNSPEPDLDQRALLARACRGMGQLLESAKPREALLWLNRGLTFAAGYVPLEEALLQLRIGAAHIALGEDALARRALETSLEQLPEHSDAAWRARILINLGVIACIEGDVDRGIASYRAALAADQPNDNLWVVVSIGHNLAIEEQIAGRWADAEASYLRSLDDAQRLGSVSHLTEIKSSLAILRTNQGQYYAADRLLQASQDAAKQYALDEQLAHIYANRADLSIRKHKFDLADTYMKNAEALIQDRAFEYMQPEALSYRALIEAREHPTQAFDLAQQAVEAARAHAYRRDIGMCLRILGMISVRCAQDDPSSFDIQQANAYFAESVAMLTTLDPYEMARAQLEWGRLLKQQGDSAGAAAHLRAAQRTFAGLGAAADLEHVLSLL